MNRLIKEYIERHADLITEEDWTTFYKDSDFGLGGSLVADLTRILLNAGINPLENMKEVPNAYLVADQQITSIELGGGITSIGRNAFFECENLKEVLGTESLETIQSAAFSGCASLKEIHLPEGLQVIEENAFSHTGLTSVHLPNSVTEVGNGCFRNCYKLKEIKFSTNLKLIRPGVCSNCPELEVAVIPEGAQAVQIRDAAFAGCVGLKDVYLPSTLVRTNFNESFFMSGESFHVNMTEE